MIWVIRIIMVFFLLMFIRYRPKLSILIGVVLLIIYINADKDYENPRDKKIQIENTNNLNQKNNFSNYNSNSSNSNYTSEQRKDIFDVIQEQRDKDADDYEYDYDNYNTNDNQEYEYYYETENRTNYRTNNEVNKVRVGAVCNDGTISNATGRGACSHHGGVAYWLYE